MKFTYALTAAFGLVGSAFAAPAPAPGLLPSTGDLPTGDLPTGDLPTGDLPTKEVTDLTDLKAPGVKPALLADLAAPVSALVTGLGLGSLAPGLAGTLTTLSDHLKRDLPAVPEVPGLSPEMVQQTVTGATAIFQKLNIQDIQDLDVAKQADVPGMDTEVVGKVVDSVTGIFQKLGLQQHLQQVVSAAPDTSSVTKNVAPSKLTELDGGLGVGLLAAIAPSVAALLTALGLGGLAPGVVTLLGTLSEGL